MAQTASFTTCMALATLPQSMILNKTLQATLCWTENKFIFTCQETETLMTQKTILSCSPRKYPVHGPSIMYQRTLKNSTQQKATLAFISLMTQVQKTKKCPELSSTSTQITIQTSFQMSYHKVLSPWTR